jgi:putative membrane protein
MQYFVLTVMALMLLSVAPAVAQSVTGPQIAAIVVAGNQVDIAAGQFAESKASNAEVKAFARQMVTDHTGVNKQATALVTKVHVTSRTASPESVRGVFHL